MSKLRPICKLLALWTFATKCPCASAITDNLPTVTAIQWDAPSPYDPVWLASVQTYPPVFAVNETRLWFWGWVYEQDVQFKLFTRRNPFEFQEIKINDTDSLRNSNFNFGNKVKVLTHGWLNHGSSPMPESIKEEFLNFLISEGVSMDDVHLIGHSLGAHVVGIAGAYVKQGPIDTITGLDPALPLFTLGNKDARLDKHDARHVEVIHTCGGYLGFASPLGHIDFYPNGGTRQPGCRFDYRGLCAHNRAHMYFSESIISTVPFTAVRCKDYDELYYNGSCEGTGETLIMGGFDIHYGKDGIYYLKTNAEKPYAIVDENS
ncbi:unnamed protein product, partial [Iphiclides podalirius]